MPWVRMYPGAVERLARSRFMQDEMQRRALAAKRRAEQISPVRTGRYRASFVVVKGVKNGKAYARLINTVEYAAFLEFGTRYMARHRVLGRAMGVLSVSGTTVIASSRRNTSTRTRRAQRRTGG